MAGFFVPSLPGHDPASEQAYSDLREQAEACTGAVAKERRIERMECRLSGRDCLLQVGRPDTATGRTVAAIIQLGRSTFTVHHLGPDPETAPEPLVLQQSEVYATTDFQ